MKKYLYDLYLTSEKNDCNDLAVQAMPMLLHDARKGVRKYTGEQTDIEALHADAAELEAQDRELLQFVGRHNRELVDAFALGNREAFNAVVAACEEKDAEQSGQ